MAHDTHSGSLWGGRFSDGPSEEMAALSRSTHFDWALADYDLQGSIAHAHALQRGGLLSTDDTAAIVAELERLRGLVQSGQLAPDPDDEDVHGALERILIDSLGAEIGGRLRAGRSRNDQIATLIRLYLRDVTAELEQLLVEFATALADLAADHTESVMPGRTHLQHAQPIVFGHHLLAHAWPMVRNRDRLRDLRSRLNRSPYGSGALAGSTLGLDAQAVADELGFEGPSENSIDATSARDLIAEALFVFAQIGVDSSRFAEDVVLWSTAEFGYVSLDDRFSTGSSIMPQKKNPDIAELARGKSGRLIGNLTGLLATLKGLPLAYNRDLQEDKEPLFDSVETLRLVLPALRGLVETLTVHPDALSARAEDGFSLATDVAEWLVHQGIAFRDAHEITGAAVAMCEEQGKRLQDLTEAELAELSPALTSDFIRWLSASKAVEARNGAGQTAPSSVRAQLAQLRDTLAG